MRLFIATISLLSFILSGAFEVQAQQVFKLNSINSRSKQMTAKTISGADQQRQYYTLHDEIIDFANVGEGDYIEMEPAPGLLSTFRVTRAESYTPTTTSFITRDIENPENTFTFTYSNGQLHGLYHKSHHEAYFFEYDKNRSLQNYVAKSSSFYDDEQFCSIHEVSHDMPVITREESRQKSPGSADIRSHLPTTASMTSSLDDEITIDVMLSVYIKGKKLG